MQLNNNQLMICDSLNKSDGSKFEMCSSFTQWKWKYEEFYWFKDLVGKSMQPLFK